MTAWRSEVHPGVLPTAAFALEGLQSSDDLDFRALKAPVMIVRADGYESVILHDGSCRIQLQVYSGTVLDGPARLAFRVEGLAGAEEKVETLNRFLAFMRKGTIPAAPTLLLRTVNRLHMALRVYPMVEEGRSDKEIAAVL